MASVAVSETSKASIFFSFLLYLTQSYSEQGTRVGVRPSNELSALFSRQHENWITAFNFIWDNFWLLFCLKYIFALLLTFTILYNKNNDCIKVISNVLSISTAMCQKLPQNVREKALCMLNLLEFCHAIRQLLKYFMKYQKKESLQFEHQF